MTEKFILIIHSSPFKEAHSAYFFAKALLEKNCVIDKVFFYGDAALTASKNIDLPDGQKSINSFWQELAKNNNLDLVVCKNSALSRGINLEQCLSEFRLGSITEIAEYNDNKIKTVVFK